MAFGHGRVKPPFDSGFQYNLNNEFLFLQNKKGWNASYIHEVLNELWEFMGMSISMQFYISVHGTLSTQRNVTLKPW